MKSWLLLFLVAVNVHAITIGQGPAIGTDKRGVTWYQEFQDWTSNDVRALDIDDGEFKMTNAFTPLTGTITGQVNTTSYPDLTAAGRRFYKVKLIGP